MVDFCASFSVFAWAPQHSLRRSSLTYSSLDFIDSLNFCKFVEKFEIAGHIIDSEQGPSVDLT